MFKTFTLDDIGFDRLFPRGRVKVASPERTLWAELLELALQRVNVVLDFAKRWPEIRLEEDYETHRAKCVFHLEWIYDDDPHNLFTFSELCRYSDSAELQNITLVRQQIQAAFPDEAAQEVMRTVPAELRKLILDEWRSNDVTSQSLLLSESEIGEE